MKKQVEERYPDYMTTGFVAKRCGVSNTTVLRWIENGRLPAFKLPSGHYRVEVKNFVQFLTSYDIPISNIPSGRKGGRKNRQ